MAISNIQSGMADISKSKSFWSTLNVQHAYILWIIYNDILSKSSASVFLVSNHSFIQHTGMSSIHIHC